MPHNLSKIVIGLYVFVMALLPFSRLAELPIVLLSLMGIYTLKTSWHIIKTTPQFTILATVFLAYLGMVLISAPDSYWQEKTLIVALASFRFFFAAIAMLHFVDKKDVLLLVKWSAFLAVSWGFDALIQFSFGIDLIGRASYAGRLNGVFGEHHVKLGPVLALMLPLVMIALRQKPPFMKWLITLILILVIILSGTRSAWIMMLFTLSAYWFYHVKYRRLQLFLKALTIALVIVTSLWFFSTDFQQRVNRSLAVLNGSEPEIDFALADRLSIWKTSFNMIKSHPINGIGAHGFRKAYADYAEHNDSWQEKDQVAMHAHHWLLEILAETGIIGLFLFVFASYKLFCFLKKHYHPHYSWAYLIALISAFLPITSLYSMFASFWSICIWFIGTGLLVVSQKDD